MSCVPQAGSLPGGVQPSHCQDIFLLTPPPKKKKMETQQQQKNQGNILVLLHFNQVIVLLWCSHYDINDGPKPAQNGGEN